MPRRVTIILNSNQTKRITVLVNDQDIKENILSQARNKFHIKALNIVYRWGGTLLDDGDELPLKEEEVLVSKGEAYIGPPSKHYRQDGRVGEVRVLADKSFVHEDAIKQLGQVAELEGVYAAIGMPDLHKGDRFPVGCAIVAEGIYPALIGTDIGCGISLYSLGSIPSHLNSEKLANILRNSDLDKPWKGDTRKWLQLYKIEKETEFDASSLGTVGGGNHFAEIVVVDRVVDASACESLGLMENGLYLLAHTGSRGLGASILRQVCGTDSNPYLTASSPELQSYLDKHDHAVIWAKANRDLLAHRIQCFLFEREPWTGPSPPGDLEKLLDVTHNSVSRLGYLVDQVPVDTWIHRKGAAPTTQGFVPCPGSRGDFSWILQPMGDGQLNAHSLAHGAGRLHPRSAHTLRKGQPNQLLVTSLDSHVVCSDKELLFQERPEAYKDIQGVVDDMEDKGIAEGVAVLRPLVTFKTSSEPRK